MYRLRNWVSVYFLAILFAVAFPGTFNDVFAAEEEDFVSQDTSGNDPRDFTSKFMPYYRYTEFENDLEINAFTMFGFLAFNGRFGMTYELPVAQENNFSEMSDFENVEDDKVVGMGDLGLRFFLRPRQWEFPYMGGKKNFALMLLVELTALYRHGHMEDVVHELENVLSRYPNDIELIGSLADFFLGHGNLPRAIEMLFSMINVYFERADIPAARRCLERIRMLEPENQRLRKFEGLLKT